MDRAAVLDAGWDIVSGARPARGTGGAATIGADPRAGAGCTGASGVRRRFSPRISRTTPAAPARIHLGKRLGGGGVKSKTSGSGGTASGAAGRTTTSATGGISAPEASASISALRTSVHGEILYQNARISAVYGVSAAASRRASLDSLIRSPTATT